MARTALFIRHRALPGKRDEVRRIWEKHLQPTIAANPSHEAYFYCYDDNDLDTISVFQQYTDRVSSQEFLTAPAYAEYLREVTPVLAGPPDVRAATPIWAKSDLRGE